MRHLRLFGMPKFSAVVACMFVFMTGAHDADSYEVKEQYPDFDEFKDRTPPNYRKLWGVRYDKGVHSLNWNVSQGWNGLIPGKTTLAQVIRKLGEPEQVVREFANLKHFDFAGGVSVMARDPSSPIGIIEVYPTEKYLANYPLTAHDAKIMYGPLKAKATIGDAPDPYLERPGLFLMLGGFGEKAAVYGLRFLPNGELHSSG